MKRTNPKRRNTESASTFEPLEGRQMFASAPGTLDPSFSVDGKQTLNFPLGGVGFAADSVVQPDGKTVVVGRVDFDGGGGSKLHRFGVARFNFDGTPDKTFGPRHDGIVTIAMGNEGNEAATAVALQANGRIVVVGSANGDTRFAVARLLSDGTLDKTFNGNGKQLIRVKDKSFANDVAIQQDGKIVVVGGDFNGGGIFTLDDSDFAICRLNFNGSLDTSFANGGKRIIGLGEMEVASAVAIDTNGFPSTNPNFGKIVLAGTFSKGLDTQKYALVRLNPNGTTDTSFGKGGSLTATFPGYSRATVNGVLIQNTRRIVVSGHASGGNLHGQTPITLARHFASDGSIDKSFGVDVNGSAYIDFGGDDRGGNVITSADDRLIVAGTSNGRFALSMLSKDGVIDSRFDGGRVVTDFGTAGTAGSVRIARGPGRRVTVVGGDRFKTARYFDFDANLVNISDVRPNAVEDGATASFLVNRSENLPVTTRVFFNISGTATNNVDYTTNLKRVLQIPPGTNIIDIATGTVTVTTGAPSPGQAFIDIPAGKTFATVFITPVDDNVVEGVETATFTMVPNAAYTLGSPSSAAVNIADHDTSGGPIIRSTVPAAGRKLSLFSTDLIEDLV